MFCKKCGKEMKDGAKFCPACGETMKQPEVPELIVHKSAGNPSVPRASGGGAAMIIVFAIIGLLIGMPVSYQFQDELFREKVPMDKYLEGIPKILFEPINPNSRTGEWERSIKNTIVKTCLICAVASGAVGYAVVKSRDKRG